MNTENFRSNQAAIKTGQTEHVPLTYQIPSQPIAGFATPTDIAKIDYARAIKSS